MRAAAANDLNIKKKEVENTSRDVLSEPSTARGVVHESHDETCSEVAITWSMPRSAP